MRRHPPRATPGWEPSDGGYVAVLTAGIVLAVMALIGLLVDSSQALAAHRRADNEAEQAARAAGQALNVAGYTAGATPALDPVAARRAAAAYLASTGDPYTITITGPTAVTVTVTVTTRMPFPIGRTAITAVGTGHSTDVFGGG